MQISNPKIASLDPTWARFRGLTVLFDNPTQPPLYDELHTVVDAMDAIAGPAGLRDRYGWCRLPADSLHVTVCDGPNDGNLNALTPASRAAVATVLDELPHSLQTLPDQLNFLVPTELQTLIAQTSVTLRVSGIFVSGHVAAVRLEPLDVDVWQQIENARDRYAANLLQHLGLRIAPWRPHISLGYFADREGATCAGEALLDDWNELLMNRVRASVAFTSAELFGFLDMTRFVRRQPGPAPGDGR